MTALSGTALLIDLDGTLLDGEILPRLANECGQSQVVENMTRAAMEGAEDFATNFERRVSLLARVPLPLAQTLALSVPVREDLLALALEWPSTALVVTSNLDCWVAPLMQKLSLPFVCSTAEVDGLGNLVGVSTILDKGAVVREMQQPVIYVGDGANDIPAFLEASVAVALTSGGQTRASVLAAVDHVFHTEEALCRYLRQWL